MWSMSWDSNNFGIDNDVLRSTSEISSADDICHILAAIRDHPEPLRLEGSSGAPCSCIMHTKVKKDEEPCFLQREVSPLL